MKEKGWDPDQYGHSTYSDSVLAAIIAEQSAIVRYAKNKGHTLIFGHLVIFDDMIDSKAAMRGKQIELLYARGRHLGISVIASTQAYRKVLNTVRSKSDDLIWRLSNGQDSAAWIEENSAIVGQ